MAHGIKLRYGSPASWSYIDLTDSDHGNVDYYPGTPDEGADEITESGRWRVAGSTVANLIAAIAAIEQVFRKASEYDADQIGANQVMLTIVPDGTADTWESPIFEGRLELTEDIFGVDWANKVTEVVLVWRRAPWWELYSGPSVTNDNIDAGIIKVYANNDGTGSAPNKQINWITVTNVAGDLPGPAILRLDLTPSAVTCDQVMIFQNAKAPGLNGAYTFQGETGSGDTVDTARSNDAYHTHTVPSGATGLGMEWTVAALNAITDGAWLRCLLSANLNGTVKITPYIKINGVKYYGASSIATAGGTIFTLYDLGLLKFPPIVTSLATFTGYTAVNYGLFMLSSAGATVGVDYVSFTPMDSFVSAKFDGLVAVGDVMAVDSRYQMATSDNGSTLGYQGTIQGNLTLTPGVTNYLYFNFMRSSVDNMTIAANVYLHYMARKKTL